MGCGGSKTVTVREKSNAKRQANNDSSPNNNNPEINLVVDSQQDNPSVNPYNNAKPRLAHSAIRRNPQPVIKPVLNDTIRPSTDDEVEYTTISSSSNNAGHISAEMLRISDSGLGNISALSANTERSRPKSSTTTTPYKSRTKTPNFGNKSHDSSIRPDSGKTGSILTTSNLNASFMTTGDDDISYNVDVTLDLHTPYSEYTDVEENTFRTLSITPSTPGMPVDPTPMVYNKQIGVIREESEGGFTPRSIDFKEDINKSVRHGNTFLPKYLPREVYLHNKQIGKQEWIIYKRKAYDRNLIISTFSYEVKEYLKTKIQERERLTELRRRKWEKADNRENKKLKQKLKDDEQVDEHEMKLKSEAKKEADTASLSSISNDELSARYHDQCEELDYTVNEEYIYYAESFENAQAWNVHGIGSLLRLDLDSEIIDKNMPICCVGEIVQPNTPRYWNDVRSDIRRVFKELNEDDVSGDLNPYQVDLKEQYEEWLRQYGDHNPYTPQTLEGDPNKRVFPLPTRTLDNPLSLRCWLGDWIPLDFGNPAWEVLPSNAIEDDILTSNQEAVETQRKLRSDIRDNGRMEKRRDIIMNYFMKKYEMQASDIEHFTKWATVMEEGERAFKKLCEPP